MNCFRFAALIVTPTSFAIAASLFACTGGGSASSGGGGPIATATAGTPVGRPGFGKAPPPPVFGGVGGKPATPPPPPSEEVDMPFVPCSTEPIDPENDAGSDADVGDAGDAGDVATSPSPSSPCDTPPPLDCYSSVYAVTYYSGYCDGVQCHFPSTTKDCKGGCFTQIDGGKRCNP